MPEFDSARQYWKFAKFVMRTARHVMDEENRRFLDAVIETSAKRVETVDEGTHLWRAQPDGGVGTEIIRDENQEEIDSFEINVPHPPERMRPRQDKAREGRVNPKGIPCFYSSTDMDTAMNEVRPWIGQVVSVAQFVTLRNLKVMDCSADLDRGPWFLGDFKPSPAKREECVWGDISRAFSQPVTCNDDVAEYAPTQVLAEVFRNSGCDAIVYGSKLGSGTTVAIFDLAATKQIDCHLYRVQSVKFEYSKAGNPYSL